ncbi:urate hydroxylase PuuD [soil metagenome]
MRFGLELLDVALRWVHVVAAIMWIGNSLLFNWLDRSLRPAAAPRDRSVGETWLLHSGGFYQVEKTLALGDVPSHTVHWFKWQAYTTWISGAALLIAVYYATGGALLVNPGLSLHPHAASAIGVGVLLGGWLVYEAVWNSRLARFPAVTSALCFLLLLALGFALGRVFTGRAAFLHVGALLGTLMAGNVRFHIMTAQRAFVASIDSGVPGDERLPAAAKLRSIHNNYMTFPVVVLMLSSHFPALHSAPSNWLTLGVLLAGGAGVRHILNVRWTFTPWRPVLAGVIAATLVALYLITVPRDAPGAGAGDDGPPVDFATAEAIVRKRCTVCHSTSPADRTFGAPAGAMAFDTPEQIRAMAERIAARAVLTRTMPPANSTWITEQERSLLGRWARDEVR